MRDLNGLPNTFCACEKVKQLPVIDLFNLSKNDIVLKQLKGVQHDKIVM